MVWPRRRAQSKVLAKSTDQLNMPFRAKGAELANLSQQLSNQASDFMTKFQSLCLLDSDAR